MKKHFVTFYSPGTFVSETSSRPIDSWDIDKAKDMARDISERYNATPYGFRFTTRERSDEELDSKDIAHSAMYYLGGKIETLAEVKARATDKESTLIGNMECNNVERIITNDNSWRFTAALEKDDVVLEWTKEVAK